MTVIIFEAETQYKYQINVDAREVTYILVIYSILLMVSENEIKNFIKIKKWVLLHYSRNEGFHCIIGVALKCSINHNQSRSPLYYANIAAIYRHVKKPDNWHVQALALADRSRS